MIIGLTGKNACGKGEVGEYLKRKGFKYCSLSDVIRDHIKKEKEEVTRSNLIKYGNILRENFGPQILAQRIMEKLIGNTNYIIDSIRNPHEVYSLRQLNNFVLVNIEADSEVRFERIKKRSRENDPKTFKSFLEYEKKEASSSSIMQQVDKCQKMADYVIKNNSTLEELHKNIAVFLKKKISDQRRPGWDQYFMNIAIVAASRSNCMKRKVASVIVKDKRIISTGYNGTPRGIKNCNEGGCPRCNDLADSGKDLEDCYCSHGEENAIVQAAYHGVSLKDAALYTTLSPCLLCTKMIINSGIKEVVYNEDYPMSRVPFELLKKAGVNARKIKVI